MLFAGAATIFVSGSRREEAAEDAVFSVENGQVLIDDGFDVFAAEVVPILRRRGLFREDYIGTTLRDHFGLPRPESRYAHPLRASA